MDGVQSSKQVIVVKSGKSESSSSYINDRRPKRRERKKLTKEDISNTANFSHVQHVGWHPEKGFNVENVDEELKAFFSNAGVSDNDLNDNDTRKFIYDFIESRRRVECLKQDIVEKSEKPESISSHVDDREPKEKEIEKKTKEDSSNPTNFTYGQHLGWLSKEGFNIERMNEDLKAFFETAGVSDKDLKDTDTRNFIFDFIAHHAGIAFERAKQEFLKKSADLSKDDSINLLRPEEHGITQVSEKKYLQDQAKVLRKSLTSSKAETKLSTNDIPNQENDSQGRDKHKTRCEIREGNTKLRVNQFENMIVTNCHDSESSHTSTLTKQRKQKKQ